MADIWQIDLLDINGTVIGQIDRCGAPDPTPKPTFGVAYGFYYWGVDSSKLAHTAAIVVIKNSVEIARIDCVKRILAHTNLQLPMAGPNWFYMNLDVRDNELVTGAGAAKDSWVLDVIDNNNKTLALVNCTQWSDDCFEVPRFMYLSTGIIAKLVLLKNGKPVAICREKEYASWPCTVIAGQFDTAHKFTVHPHEWLSGEAVVSPAKVCTCGGWAVYGKDAGIHSDTVAFTCDLLR